VTVLRFFRFHTLEISLVPLQFASSQLFKQHTERAVTMKTSNEIQEISAAEFFAATANIRKRRETKSPTRRRPEAITTALEQYQAVVDDAQPFPSTPVSSPKPATTINSQPGALLFKLPVEVRRMIYQYALAFTWDQFEDHDMLEEYQPFVEQTFSHPLPGLLLSCKRLYRDAAPVALTHVAIRATKRSMFSARDYVGLAASGHVTWSGLQSLHYIFSPASLPVCSSPWLNALEGVLAAAPGLRRLVFEWQDHRLDVAVEQSHCKAARHFALGRIPRARDERHFLHLWSASKRRCLEVLCRAAERPALRVLQVCGRLPPGWVRELKKRPVRLIQSDVLEWSKLSVKESSRRARQEKMWMARYAV